MIIKFELIVECSQCGSKDKIERVVEDEYQLIRCTVCKRESKKMDVFLRTYGRFSSIECLCEVTSQPYYCLF